MTRKPIVRTTLLLIPFQLVRAGEPLLPVLLAAWFGSNASTDVYYLALAFFTFVASLSFGIFKDSVLVPMLAEARMKDSDFVATVAGSFLAHVLVYGTAFAALVGVVAFGWFRYRYGDAEFGVAARMVVPFALFLVALSVKTLFAALLNAYYKFFAYPLAAGLGVASTIGVIALTRGSLGVVAIPVGSLVGELVAVAVLAWIALGLMKMKFVLTLERPEPVRRFVGLALPDVAGGAVTRINPVLDQIMIAMTGVIGGGTLLKQAGDIGDFPTAILQSALLPVLLTHLSDDFAHGRVAAFRKTVTRSLATVCGLLIAGSLLIFVVRAPVLRLVFLHGAMQPAAVERLASILPYYLIGLAPSGAALVLARAHIAIKNTRIMLPMGILNATVHGVLNFAFVKTLGLEGLALSASAVNIVVAAVFWVTLESRLRREPARATPTPPATTPHESLP